MRLAMDLRSTGSVLPKAQLEEMLRRMMRIRQFDTAASRVKATSIAGMLHNTTGQEGEIVGSCMALREDDYMTGTHRSHGHPIGKGAPLAPLMAELFGKATGVCGGKGGSMHLAAFAVGSLGESGIVGASMPVAVGAALSARFRGTDQVCLSFFGDGGSNCGAFHESLNLAAIWNLPVIFLCENNGYATVTPHASASAVTDVATRAAAYAMPSAIVDGQDVLAVYDVVSTYVASARAGGGPALIEAKTYRYCDHIEGFSFPIYRPDGELDAWRARDPIPSFSDWLKEHRVSTEEEVRAIEAQVESEIAAALEFAEHSASPAPQALLDNVFA